jgi:hypothetical protein
MTMSDSGEARGSGFYVQCLSGHVSEVLKGSSLEEKCRQRRARGRLDALCITADQCPSCLQERIHQDREFVRSCEFAGCALDGEGRPRSCAECAVGEVRSAEERLENAYEHLRELEPVLSL